MNNPSIGQIFSCRICNSKNIEQFLSLGNQPWCDNFLKKSDLEKVEPKYPLELYFCKDCTLVQLGYTIPKEVMFIDYVYLSGTTKALGTHFESVAKNIVQRFNLSNSDLVLDIGSNDGTFLEKFKNLGIRVLGVDPGVKQVEIAKTKGIETVNEFFNEKVANSILEKYGNASAISAAGVFFHLEELHSVVRGIKKLLSSKGVFVIQATYLPSIVKKNAFDIVYHEHLVYYTIKTLRDLLSQHDLQIFDVEKVPIHGGSIIVYSSHPDSYEIDHKVQELLDLEQKEGYYDIKKYQEFAKNVHKIKTELLTILSTLKKQGKTIYGYGAPAKGNTMLNFCGINSSKVDFLVEKNELKCNLYAPGTRIKVIHENDVKHPPDYFLILPWNFLDTFLKKEKRFLAQGGKFIVPIPKPKILDKLNTNS